MYEQASSVHIFNPKEKENMLLEKPEHIISVFHIRAVTFFFFKKKRIDWILTKQRDEKRRKTTRKSNYLFFFF